MEERDLDQGIYELLQDDTDQRHGEDLRSAIEGALESQAEQGRALLESIGRARALVEQEEGGEE
jgi:hypothetical protein